MTEPVSALVERLEKWASKFEADGWWSPADDQWQALAKELREAASRLAEGTRGENFKAAIAELNDLAFEINEHEVKPTVIIQRIDIAINLLLESTPPGAPACAHCGAVMPNPHFEPLMLSKPCKPVRILWLFPVEGHCWHTVKTERRPDEDHAGLLTRYYDDDKCCKCGLERTTLSQSGW